MNEIIKLENVIKIVGNNRRAINDLSLCVQKGEQIQICGAPGSGKTTLMRLIAGMERPSDGKIFVQSKVVHAMKPNNAAHFRNKTFGVSLCNKSFLSDLTVWENVAMPLVIRRTSTAKRKKMAIDQLKTLGLGHIANAYPSQISAYESHMISFARATISEPEILLLDEITGGLTEKEVKRLMAAIRESCRNRNVTVIFFTAVEIDTTFANRRIILDCGKIKEEF